MSYSNIVKASSVRTVLLLHNILSVWRVTVVWNNHYFWLLMLANIPFIVEGIYIVIRKDGVEWKWLCLCFLFYLMSTMPAIWLLEIHRQETYTAINITALAGVNIAGVHIPIQLSSDMWVLIIEECLLYLMILGRWFLPRGKVSREQLSQLLFSFIAIASDIMEFFSLFDEDIIRSNIVLTYILLSLWTWSIMQFTLVLTIYSQPKRAKLTETSPRDRQREIFRLEVIAILISILMQDGPFLCLRLYCIIHFHLATYSIVFFTAKNILIILLLVYRICVICIGNYYSNEAKYDRHQNRGAVMQGFVTGLRFEFDNGRGINKSETREQPKKSQGDNSKTISGSRTKVSKQTSAKYKLSICYL